MVSHVGLFFVRDDLPISEYATASSASAVNFQTTWILPTWGDPPGLILQHVPPQRITDLEKCHTNTPKLSCILDSCLSEL